MFRMIRRRPVICAFALFVIAVAGLTIAQPNTAACAVFDLAPLERLSDGSLVDSGLSPAQRRAVVAYHAKAIARITKTFGPPRAHPLIVHLSHGDALWPFHFNPFGSTSFLPGRACIVLGPAGENADVLAHELVHAEIFDRVGFWQRLTQIPTWFDEGAAMQVDYRTAFDLPKGQSAASASAVRLKDTSRKFFNTSPKQLTLNYAHAKATVAILLNRIGRDKFYEHLSEQHKGKNFDQVWLK